jgi:short-subunit dehydrogenase
MGATVLLTGADGGFGRQFSMQLLNAGSKLILSDRDECVDSLRSSYGDRPDVLTVIGADLSVNAGCDQLHDAVRNLGVSPDILINNAGIAFSGRPDLVPDGHVDRLMQINLLSPMRLSQLILPQMIERQRGHIVNISSVAGWIGGPGISAYCASKFGLRGFGESLATDLAEFNIRISTVYPWFSRTPILESEQFGVTERREVPADVVTDPADVVEAMLKGIRADKEHIFPDAMARRIQLVKRFFPWLIPIMQNRLEKKTA